MMTRPPRPRSVRSPIRPTAPHTALQIFGTNSNDTITIAQVGTGQGKAKVTINGSNKGTFSFTGSIVVFGQDGNDKITVGSGITRTVYGFGGFGDDTIAGGGGADVLEGEAGNDSLAGGAGTRHPHRRRRHGQARRRRRRRHRHARRFRQQLPPSQISPASIPEWIRTDATYAQRVDHIENGGGKNTIKLNKSTCFSSIALRDTVTGGTGSDLFLVAVNGDMITGCDGR